MTYCDETTTVYVDGWPFYLRTPAPAPTPVVGVPQPLPVPDRLADAAVRRRDVEQGAA